MFDEFVKIVNSSVKSVTPLNSKFLFVNTVGRIKGLASSGTVISILVASLSKYLNLNQNPIKISQLALFFLLTSLFEFQVQHLDHCY